MPMWGERISGRRSGDAMAFLEKIRFSGRWPGNACCSIRIGRFVAAISLVPFVGLLLTACATAPAPVWSYKLYPGPERPVTELAVVRMGDASAAEFNGRPVARRDWTEVHLLPGEYTVRWQVVFGVSVLIEPSGYATGGWEARVPLEAGQTYRLRADRTTGHGYRMFFWIEDVATGAVVAGTRKP